MAEGVRFIDILTTASAVADYLGHLELTATDVIEAVAILRDERTLEDLGPGRSPLVRRLPGEGAVSSEVRDLVQLWFDALGRDIEAELDEAGLAAFLGEVRELG
jgi:hypothetical protein